MAGCPAGHGCYGAGDDVRKGPEAELNRRRKCQSFFFDKIKLESLTVYLPEGGVASTGFDFPPPGTKKK